jgi:hypothetical protein
LDSWDRDALYDFGREFYLGLEVVEFDFGYISIYIMGAEVCFYYVSRVRYFITI